MSIKNELDCLKKELFEKNEEILNLKLKIEKDQSILEEKEVYFQDILSHVPGFLYWLNTDNIYQGCNPALANSLGLKSNKEIVGKRNKDLIWKKQAHQLDLFNNQVMNSGHSHRAEEVVAFNDIERTFISEKIPIFNKKNTVIGLIGISVDITEQKKTEQELVIAKEKAEIANLAKTEFIANMSHDIRTPLTGVIGMSHMLEDALSDPKQKLYAHLLGESGDQLLNMLNGILDVISADNINENDLHLESFNLKQMMQDIIRLEHPTTLIKGIELIQTIDKDIPDFIFSDPAKLHRIILNLLGNAIKFTENGVISIGARLLKQTKDTVVIQFSVKDTGIGIPIDMQEKVFERFFRVSPSYKGIYTGHGLGLHIAQSYAHLLGGKIKLTSEVNKGTAFYFDLTLKLVQEQTKPLVADIAKDTSYPEYSRDNLPMLKTPKLLLVEDNMIALMMLENMVKKAGCDYQSAKDGQIALALAKSHPFDAIITDLGLPQLSGIEWTREFRLFEQEKQRAPTPIIGLTAHADEQIKLDCIQAGMNEAYTKPMTYEILYTLYNKYLLSNHKTISQISEKQQKSFEKRLDSVDHSILSNPHPAGRRDMNSQQTSSTDLPATEEELFELNSLPLLDAQTALSSMNNNITLFNKILNSMINSQIPNDLNDIKQAFKNKKWDSVEHIAHRMKGGFVYCGIARLSKACLYLERYHKAGFKDKLPELYHQVLQVSTETQETIKRWLALQN